MMLDGALETRVFAIGEAILLTGMFQTISLIATRFILFLLGLGESNHG
jgi:hypothetical protein